MGLKHPEPGSPEWADLWKPLVKSAQDRWSESVGSEQKFMPTDNPKLLDFVAEQEPWNVYRLENGTVIRAKIIMTRIVDTGALTAEGEPFYQLKWQHIIDVTFPDHLKAKP